ncbi:MAG: hypothetical protein NC093_09125 [Alistipes sp.]|nr:hypothetical protein [Alistipes sp.]
MKTCKYCGIDLREPGAHRQYCPECLVIRREETDRVRRRKELLRRVLGNMQPLHRDIRAADARKMTYGRYMAWKQEQEARQR